MKKTAKRITSAVLACTMAAGLAACAPKEVAVDFTDYSGPDKTFTEPTQLEMVIPSHVSWPYNENWPLWTYMQEASGANLKITAIPDESWETKVSLMMSNPDALPDLMNIANKETVDRYALSGAFLSYTDNVDKMPNAKKYFDSLPEGKRENFMLQRTSGDGKVYAPPTCIQSVVDGRSWIYRKDIFEKHGLQLPTTSEELYQVLKKLKELYPESYPLCVRGGVYRLEDWGPSWQKDFTFQEYYDYDAKVWRYGAAEDVCKEMVEFFRKLREEGLVSPDFTDISNKAWEELMSNDRGFVGCDYLVRIDFFNTPCRAINPEYTWAAMAPPKGGNEGGRQKIVCAAYNLTGFAVCNTGDEEKQDAAFKFLDWMYTDEAAELVGWGKEGETYKIDEEGDKAYILEGDETPQAKYGFGLTGSYQRIADDALEALYTKEMIATAYEVQPYMEDYVNPQVWLSFDESVETEAADLRQELFNYTMEQLSKFMLGQQPMSEWDNFQQGLKDLGVDRLLELYTQAYDRVAG